MKPLEQLRLEKAAGDCGFERTPVLLNGDGLELRSAHFPEVVTVWLDRGRFRVITSNAAMLDRAEEGDVVVADLEQLYALLQRASAVARTLPNRVADQFKRATQGLPETTEAERLVIQRVGQDLFRAALLDYWQGRCCVTGLALPGLLRASHIKPWAKCFSDEERLDVFNGLLLAPHIDALFDGGWISFSHDGSLLVSSFLPGEARRLLGVSENWRIGNIKEGHGRYLEFHRMHEMR